jgi:MFS family permease
MGTASEQNGGFPQPGRAWYAVLVLMVCYTLSFVDRQILAFLVGPLKHDLHLSDTQIGLLQGLAFAVFYTLLGVPMGLLADRINRRNLIGIGVVVWSLMTALGSVARSFGSLAVVRMGVGLGEATLAPAAFSMIADYFPKERLSSALSVYSMGVQLGSGIALIAGGVVVQAVSHMPPVVIPVLGTLQAWRLTFLVVGLPGLLAALLLGTVHEPARRQPPALAISERSRVGGSTLYAELRKRWRSVIGISIVMACQAMSNYAFGGWSPAFFERVHHWPKSRTGLVLGVITIICGCIGLVVGGRLSDRWLRAGRHDATLRVGLVSLVGVAFTLIPAMAGPSLALTLVLLVPAVFFLALSIGSSFASIQMIFPNEVRGAVSAVMLLVLNIGGLALGLLLPGLLDDRLFHDENMVGYSIAVTAALATSIGSVAACLTFAPYRRDFAAMHLRAGVQATQ